MTRHKVYDMRFGSVYPAYVAKAERKGRTKAEVDEIICWLTGHDQASLDAVIASETNCEAFITGAPRLNPARELITGSVCGVKVQDVQEPVMRELRYMDKLIDELAKGKAMEKKSCERLEAARRSPPGQLLPGVGVEIGLDLRYGAG